MRAELAVPLKAMQGRRADRPTTKPCVQGDCVGRPPDDVRHARYVRVSAPPTRSLPETGRRRPSATSRLASGRESLSLARWGTGEGGRKHFDSMHSRHGNSSTSLSLLPSPLRMRKEDSEGTRSPLVTWRVALSFHSRQSLSRLSPHFLRRLVYPVQWKPFTAPVALSLPGLSELLRSDIFPVQGSP